MLYILNGMGGAFLEIVLILDYYSVLYGICTIRPSNKAAAAEYAFAARWYDWQQQEGKEGEQIDREQRKE